VFVVVGQRVLKSDNDVVDAKEGREEAVGRVPRRVCF